MHCKVYSEPHRSPLRTLYVGFLAASCDLALWYRSRLQIPVRCGCRVRGRLHRKRSLRQREDRMNAGVLRVASHPVHPAKGRKQTHDDQDQEHHNGIEADKVALCGVSAGVLQSREVIARAPCVIRAPRQPVYTRPTMTCTESKLRRTLGELDGAVDPADLYAPKLQGYRKSYNGDAR
jgi:hypothetical protein